MYIEEYITELQEIAKKFPKLPVVKFDEMTDMYYTPSSIGMSLGKFDEDNSTFDFYNKENHNAIIID